MQNGPIPGTLGSQLNTVLTEVYKKHLKYKLMGGPVGGALGWGVAGNNNKKIAPSRTIPSYSLSQQYCCL